MSTTYRKDFVLLRLPLNFRATCLISSAAIMLSACSSTSNTPLTGAKNHAVSSAVVYQTESKEYPVLASYVYANATAALPKVFNANDVVVMDVDETVLDNSQYQRERESAGLGYSSESWNAWVMRKEATLVPGVEAFISAVIAKGGKLALITNRNKSLDGYTWENLLALGLPLTSANTCMLGRTERDKTSVGQENIINDKDFRRLSVTNGTVNCSNADGKETWTTPHNIVMQIGDNIEDFANTTQESADVDVLLPHIGKTLFLLPNPMYGSW